MVRSRELGIIGKAHLRTKFNGEEKTFRYRKVEIEVDGVPYLAEMAFDFDPDEESGTLMTGLNWSVSVGDSNPFQFLGSDSLDGILADQWAGPDEPIEFFLHVASPRLSVLNRGKNSVSLPGEVGYAIEDAILDVTKRWAKQRTAEVRDANAARRRLERLTRADKPQTLRDVAFDVMTEAYMEASDDNKLPANARQVMYAARPKILAVTGETELSNAYFTQTLVARLCERALGRVRGLGCRLERSRALRRTAHGQAHRPRHTGGSRLCPGLRRARPLRGRDQISGGAIRASETALAFPRFSMFLVAAELLSLDALPEVSDKAV